LKSEADEKFSIGAARTWRAALVILTLGVARQGSAQDAPSFGGLAVAFGTINPVQAGLGFNWRVGLDFGAWVDSRLRIVVSGTGFSADVERQIGGVPTGGRFDAVGGLAGLRWDLFPGGRIAPYATGSVAGLVVDASVADPGTKRLLDGFYVGAELGGGLAYAIDSLAKFALTGEIRRGFVTNVGHWIFEVGLRWMPRGRRSYLR
jgi:hypothetical protein